MKIILGVKDFGKVKSAEIGIGGFSVFVGNNNSGKTYIMQLIYGIRKNLARYLSDADLCSRHLQHLEEQAENGRVCIDAQSIKMVEDFINAVLQKYKEKIVLDTFYKEIEIGEIYVRLLMEEEEHFEWLIYKTDYGEARLDEIISQLKSEQRNIAEELKNAGVFKESHKYRILFKIHHLYGEKEKGHISLYSGDSHDFLICSKIVCSAIDMFIYEYSAALFIPASRTGLFMLYKDFFANKTDEAVEILRVGEFIRNYKESKNLGITKPVYKYLRFLQTYRPHRDAEKNRELIQFIEEHLIDGRIVIDQADQPVYQVQGAQQALPLYLSSSMVNELTPVLYVLQSDFRYLIWDEIETSLHPQKQMELARLLSRMSNAGFSMIVSTHSDTMAAKINNLCLLSFSRLLRGKRAEILKKAGLEEADLFKERIHVYQFENDDSGRSSVRELEYDEVTGYQFSLFNDSIEQLLEETRLILE